MKWCHIPMYEKGPKSPRTQLPSFLTQLSLFFFIMISLLWQILLDVWSSGGACLNFSGTAQLNWPFIYFSAANYGWYYLSYGWQFKIFNFFENFILVYCICIISNQFPLPFQLLRLHDLNIIVMHTHIYLTWVHLVKSIWICLGMLIWDWLTYQGIHP